VEQVAQNAGLWDDWDRTRWETVYFESSADPVRMSLQKHLLETGQIRPPCPPGGYQLSVAMDRQNGRLRPFDNPHDVCLYVLQLTRLLALVSDTTMLEPALMHCVYRDVVHGAILGSPFAHEIVTLGHVLHIHSTMTLAQIKRIVRLFWLLSYALVVLQARC
jgi:hypothetical protein